MDTLKSDNLDKIGSVTCKHLNHLAYKLITKALLT